MEHGTTGDEESGRTSPVALDSVRLTVLFDNYSYSDGFETGWGFSCLVEGTNKTILFDTGSDGALLMKNIEAGEIDPGVVDIVFLSHYHWDHTGGLERFLQENRNVTLCVPASFPDTFDEAMREAGIETIEIGTPGTVCDGVLSTGEMGSRIKEQSLVIETDAGLIVITGCAHPGIVDIVERAREIDGRDVLFVFGGFHLRGAGGSELERIVSRFEEMGVRFVGPSHCTGDEAIEAFKDAFGERYISIGTGRIISASDLNRAE